MMRFYNILFSILTISGAIWIMPCRGQDYYSAAEALPSYGAATSSTITCMEKDNAGYLWIGTTNGLFRYNGTSFRSFKQTDSLALSSNFITTLRADRGGNLWVGTDDGIHLVNSVEIKRNSILESGTVYGMANINQGILVHSGKEGLYIYDKERGESKLVYKDYNLAYSPCILLSQDRIFVISDNGSYRLHVLDISFKPVSVIDFGKNSINGITYFSGQVAVATSEGLRFFDAEGKRVPLPEKLKVFENRNILFCKTDEYRMELVIGAKDIGIFRYFDTSDSLTRTWQEENLSDTDKCECVVMKDNLAINKDGRIFSISHESSIERKMLSGLARSESIRSVFSSDDTNNALVFTDRGIYLFNLLTQNTNNLTRAILGEDKYIEKGYLDKDYNIWTITDEGVLTKYLFSRTNSGVRYSLGKQYDGDYSNSELICLNSGMMVVVSPTRIIFFDDEGNTLSERLPEGTAKTPYISSSGEMYLFGKEGVFKAGNSGPVEKIPVDIEATCLSEDNIGNLWIGTRDRGICIYNPASKGMIWITTEDGLPENDIKSILLLRNRIWICGSSSIAYKEHNSENIVTIENESSTAKYNVNCGTVTDIIGLGVRVMFAGKQNLTILNPNREESKRDIRLFLDEVSAMDLKIPTNGNNVVIPNKNNNLMFTYSSIDFNYGGKLNYEYILEGHDKDWTRAGNVLHATYNHLKGGNYNFRVRVMTPTGEYSSSEISFPFRIKGSLKGSWLFFLMLSIFFVLIALMLIGIFTSNRLNREQYLREKKEKELFAEYALVKRGFPKWVTENFLNTLSLIYAPLRELEQEKSLKQDARLKIGLISKNVGKIKRTIGGEWYASIFGSDSSERPLFIFEHPVNEVPKAIEDFIDKLQGEKYLKTIDNVPPESKACFDSSIISSIAFLTAAKYFDAEGKNKVMRVDSRIMDAAQAEELTGKRVKGYDGPYLQLSFKLEADKRISFTDRLAAVFGEKEAVNEDIDKYQEALRSRIRDEIKRHKGVITIAEDLTQMIIPCGKEAYDIEEQGTDNTIIEEFKRISPLKLPENNDILIAENDKSLRDYLADTFRQNSNIILATNGKDAVDLFDENKIDIAVIDTSLPSIDGYSLCAKIKSSPEGMIIPVILISSDTDPESELKANNVGADYFLRKPFDMALLTAKAATLVHNTGKIISKASAGEAKNAVPIQKVRKLSESDMSFLERLNSVIDRNISTEGFTARSLADEMGMNYTQFYTRTKDVTGLSPKELLMNQRLEAAMNMLKEGKMNISEISFLVGFSSIGNFSRAFKAKYGVTPSSI